MAFWWPRGEVIKVFAQGGCPRTRKEWLRRGEEFGKFLRSSCLIRTVEPRNSQSRHEARNWILSAPRNFCSPPRATTDLPKRRGEERNHNIDERAFAFCSAAPNGPNIDPIKLNELRWRRAAPRRRAPPGAALLGFRILTLRVRPERLHHIRLAACH